MGGEKSKAGMSYSGCPEGESGDFSHQGPDPKLMKSCGLGKISTFPQRLLLLLVLLVLHLI